MKTKTTHVKIFTIVIFMFLNLHAFSQAPNWTWETNPYGVSYDGADATATDALGNIYVTGYFYGSSIDFGGFVLTNASGGWGNMFIVKYDDTGVVLWAESAGGVAEDAGYSVTTDASNNVYVTGYFFSPSITFGSTTLINQGEYDMFIVKYDPLGTVLWAQSAGRAFDDYGRSVITDAMNNVYVTGSFKSAGLIFGSTTLANTDSTENTYDMFLVKYDSTGTILWAKSATGDSSEYSRSVSTDASGNIYVTGNFDSPTLTFGSTTIVNNGSFDMYLVKYDSAGNVIWAKSAGGADIDHGYNTATDAFGNIYVSGGFKSDSMFIDATTLINSGAFNIYLAKYDSAGTLLWAQKAGGSGTDAGHDVATDAIGNIYLTGYFNSPTLVFGSTTLMNAGSYDIFIVKYDSTGTVMWAKSAGELDEEYGFSVATHSSAIYIAGRFRSTTIDFSYTLVNEGGDDVFLAKIEGSGVGIEESNMNSEVLIYPNPSNGNITINTNATLVSQIEIFNVLGERIYKSLVTNTKFEIDLSSLPKGVYFIRIIDEQNTIKNKKIIIQ